MRVSRVAGMVVLALLIALAVNVVARAGGQAVDVDRRQAALDPFYTPPDPLPATPGALIRIEPLGALVPGASSYRILYRSEAPDGTPTVSGGELFIPAASPPAGGRPVVAWAHPTVGQGDRCAPSRGSDAPAGTRGSALVDTTGWLPQLMALGAVVVATDYSGLGTPGDNLYLVGQAEARDVVNAVRAARAVPQAEAGRRFAVWGHSQGGHAALWTGHLAASLAPELTLVGVAAAAPAADLVPIMNQQWQGVVGWVIGPEVAVSWPVVDPALPLDGVLSAAGLSSYRAVAQDCLLGAGLTGLAEERFGRTFFERNPALDPAWARLAREQTPAPLPAAMPVLIAQGTADEVVLASTNAAVQERWCAAGATISMLWLGGVNHNDAASAGGPTAVAWIVDRFAGRPAPRTCDVPPPVAPASDRITPDPIPTPSA